MKNLGDAVERTVARHRRHLTAVPGLDDTPARLDISEIAAALPHGPVEPHLRADRTAVRTRERYAQVHTLMAQGHSLRSIGRELGLARGTIRDEFKPYLHQRWNQGTTNATSCAPTCSRSAPPPTSRHHPHHRPRSGGSPPGS